MDNKAIRERPVNLKGQIVHIEKEDLLGSKSNRYYLIFKDEQGKQVEAFPLTSELTNFNNIWEYKLVICSPKLPRDSVVLTAPEFKRYLERTLALESYNKQKYFVSNFDKIYKQIIEYDKKRLKNK